MHEGCGVVAHHAGRGRMQGGSSDVWAYSAVRIENPIHGMVDRSMNSHQLFCHMSSGLVKKAVLSAVRGQRPKTLSAAARPKTVPPDLSTGPSETPSRGRSSPVGRATPARSAIVG